jgi:hypothetical protein
VIAGVLVALIPSWLSPVTTSGGATSPNSPISSPSTTAAAVPFTVAAHEVSACSQYVLAQPTSSLDYPDFGNDPDALQSWAQRHDAAATATHVQFTIQGRSDAQVTLTGLAVRVIKRQTAPQGTAVTFACGGGQEFRGFSVALDPTPPRVSTFLDTDAASVLGVPAAKVTPITFPYRVSLTDAETFVAIATSVSCDCSWVMDVDWTSEGRGGVVVIDNGGQPFHTTSAVNALVHCGPARTPDGGLGCGQ